MSTGTPKATRSASSSSSERRSPAGPGCQDADGRVLAEVGRRDRRRGSPAGLVGAVEFTEDPGDPLWSGETLTIEVDARVGGGMFPLLNLMGGGPDLALAAGFRAAGLGIVLAEGPSAAPPPASPNWPGKLPTAP